MQPSVLPEPERVALTLIKLWLGSTRDWFGFITRNEDEPLPIAEDVPPWVRTIQLHLEKSLLAPARCVLDKPPCRAGGAVGFMRWGLRVMNRKPPPEVRQAWKKIRLSRPARKQWVRLWQDFLVSVRLAARTKGQLRFLHEREFRQARRLETRWAGNPEFHRSLGQGLQGLGPNASGDRSNDATPVYLHLVFWWRLVATFRSVTMLHEWLTICLGPRAGDISRTARLCGRIKLKLCDRGAPRLQPEFSLKARLLSC